MSRRSPDEAQSITSAPEPLGADQARRARRYLIQMGIRVACFVLAVLTWTHVPLWLSLTLIVGAVVLPYIAVLFANAGRERRDDAPSVYVQRQIDAAPPVRPVAPPPTGAPRPHGPGPRSDGPDDTTPGGHR